MFVGQSSFILEGRKVAKSGCLRCADEFKQQENKSSDNIYVQANLL